MTDDARPEHEHDQPPEPQQGQPRGGAPIERAPEPTPEEAEEKVQHAAQASELSPERPDPNAAEG